MNDARAYELAQSGIAMLKSAVYRLLAEAGDKGLRNVDIGRRLGIYHGHKGHVGHMPRTVLGIMEAEGSVKQGNDKRWFLADADDSESGYQDDDSRGMA